jgi:hypothetical protein
MNPDPLSNSMKYRDALIVATILMFASIASGFLPFHPFEVWQGEALGKTAYELVTFAFSTWIASFVTLTGLTAYAKSKEGDSK